MGASKQRKSALPAELHDWRGRWCLFNGAVDVDGRPVLGKDDFVLPGEKEFSAEVVEQRFLGYKVAGSLRGLEVFDPDWELTVRGASGKQVKIYHRANRFRLCID